MYDHEERLQGLRCVAAPVTLEDGKPVAPLSVCGQTSRIEGDHFHEEIPELFQSAVNVVGVSMVYSRVSDECSLQT